MHDRAHSPDDPTTRWPSLSSADMRLRADSASNPSPDTARIGHPLQHPQHLAWRRLVLLIAAIAMMASMACVLSVERGIRYVDVTEEAGLIAILGSDFGEPYYTHYSSVDGGLTWTLESNEPQTYGEFNLVVDTPRGRYTLEDPDIVRTGSGNERLAVYSSAYLQQPGNRWFQGNDTAHFSNFISTERVLASEPLSIAHDPTTGNVVVAMGLQGVVVGTPDEQWQRAAVGPYTPTDFSFTGKSMRLLFNLPFWLASIALTLSMLGLSLFFSQLNRRRLRICLWTFVSTLIGASALLFLSIRFDQVPYFLPYVSLFFVAFAVILIILAVILTALKPSTAVSRSITAAFLGVLCLGLASGAIVAFSIPDGNLITVVVSPVVYVLVGLLLVVSGEDLVGYGTISRFLAAANGLVFFSFMIWLHTGIQTWIAVAMAVTLTAGAAFIYTVYLRSKNRPDDQLFVDNRPELVLHADSAPPHSE